MFHYLSHSFLAKVYRRSGILFVLIMLYSLLVVRSIYLKKETIPFYIFSMYSGHYGDWNEYEVPLILIDGEVLDLSQEPYHRFEFLMSLLHQYKRLIRTNFKGMSNHSKDEFKVWILNYISKLTGNEIRDIELRLDVYSFEQSSYHLKTSHRLLYHVASE